MAETPMRFFRLDDQVWRRAQARASREGTNMSALIRAWVTDYADEAMPVDRTLARIADHIRMLQHRLKGE